MLQESYEPKGWEQRDGGPYKSIPLCPERYNLKTFPQHLSAAERLEHQKFSLKNISRLLWCFKC